MEQRAWNMLLGQRLMSEVCQARYYGEGQKFQWDIHALPGGALPTGAMCSGKLQDQVSQRRRPRPPAKPPASTGQCPALAPGQLAAGPHTSVLAHCSPAAAAGWQRRRPGSAGRAAPARPQGSQLSRRVLESVGTRHRLLVRERAEDSVYSPSKT